jgi:hypothetical protein
VFTELQQEYDQVCFQIVAVDSEQKAIKVFMNTFYGEAGNQRSPSFQLLLAGGVTSRGQFIITNATKFAISNGCRLKYGDTDSMYLIAKQSLYEGVRAQYKAKTITKLEYWTELVQITMDYMRNFVNDVNAYMEKLTGSKFIKFAYEDVLFPVAFTGKKKYFAIAHIGVVNFKPKELFIRGIDVIKQGQTDLVKTIGNRIMQEAMKVDNERTLREIVEYSLQDAMNENWDRKYFVQSSTYKPAKNNITVKTFVARMEALHDRELKENKARDARGEPLAELLYKPPEPGERFDYVLQKLGAQFDVFGCKRTLKKGDRMVYAHIKGIEVDVAEYITKYAVGLCARFISYDKAFAPAVTVTDETAIDKYSRTAAEKHLKKLLIGEAPVAARKEGSERRASYRAITKSLHQTLDPAAAKMLVGEFRHDSLLHDNTTETFTTLVTAAQSDAKKCVRESIAAVDDLFEKHVELRKLIKSLEIGLDRLEARLRTEMLAQLPKAESVALRFDYAVTGMVEDIHAKKDVEVTFDLSAEETEAFAALHKAYYGLVGVFSLRARFALRSKLYQEAKNNRLRVAPRPAATNTLVDSALDRVTRSPDDLPNILL